LIREFHLSRRETGGVSCDAEGAFIGSIPILRRLQRNGTYEWLPRDCDDLSEQMSAEYGLPIDMSPKAGGLKAIAKALNERDVARAQIATVLLGVPDPLPLSKGESSLQQMINLVCDLNWSGMLKWDSDDHPRWPAGSADGRGGEFAPKDTEADAALAPRSAERETGGRSTRTRRLADAGMSDAAADPVAEAAARAAEVADDAPKLVVAAADAEDERDPRFGIGGNRRPPEELIPERLQQSPAGPVVQFLDNLLDLTGPADEANLALAQAQMHALLQAIHDVDPDYVYESITPPGGLADMSWQERRNVINGLQADLAAAIYRVRGDIKPLQEVTLEFMQRTANDAYDEAVKKFNVGEQVAIGNEVDGIVRSQLRNFYNGLGIATGPGSVIRVNRRAYDTSEWPPSFRVPDARVGNFIFDVSLEAKKASKDQIRDFFAADFAPVGVVIVRPNQLGRNSSYIIWRQNGD